MNKKKTTEEFAFISADELDANQKSLFDILMSIFDCEEKGVYFHGENGSVFWAYKFIFQKASKLVMELRNIGLKEKDKVVFQLKNHEDFLVAFWGCVLGGYVPVLLPVPLSYGERNVSLDKLQISCKELGVSLIITDFSLEKDLSSFCEKNLSSHLKIKAIKAEDISGADGNFDEKVLDDFSVIVLSSGSTGRAKAITLTAQNLAASFAGKQKEFDLDEKDIFLNWMPLDHVSGIIEGHLLPLFTQANQVQVKTDYVLVSPLRFLDVISKHSVSFTFTSNFIFSILNNLIEKAGKKSWDLSSLRVLISGGEPTVTKSAKKFLLLLTEKYKLHSDCIIPGFGMSETCAGIIFSKNFSLSNSEDSEFASLGYPMSGVSICIVDKSGELATKNTVGKLKVKGDMIIGGYYNRPNDNSFDEEHWFDTGDLGYIGESGLVLVGRAKDNVIINGVNYSSQELEELLGDLEELELSAVAVCAARMPGDESERMVVFVGVEGDGNIDYFANTILKIKRKMSHYVGSVPAAIIPLQKSKFPRTSIGKIHRSKLRDNFENGEYNSVVDEVARSLKSLSTFIEPENDTEEKIRKIYSEVLELPDKEISTSDNFFDLGGSSLKTILLKTALDKKFDMDVEIVKIFQHPTIKSLSLNILNQEKMEYFPLVPLQAQGDKQPLFCVHPGVGDVLVFVEFAKRLRHDRPFYGIRARGFNEGEDCFSSLEEMVDCYVSAILKVQHEGPYYIAGYSYGGAVAFEIAKKLKAMGKEIAFIGIINLPPSFADRLRQFTYLKGLLNLALFIKLYSQQEIGDLRSEIQHLTEKEQLNYVFNHAPTSRLEELDLTVEKMRSWLELAQAMIRALGPYNPSGYVDKLTIFYAIPLEGEGTKKEWLKKLKVWDGLTKNKNDYLEVPGRHYTLMDPEHVKEFTRIFQQAMDDAT